MKLRAYHIANPPDKGFQFAVESVDQAKLVLNICACLDLENLAHRIFELAPAEKKTFIERVANAYKAYRRERGINGAWLIDCSAQGLEVWNENDEEWEEWIEENEESPFFGCDISEIIRNEDLFI